MGIESIKILIINNIYLKMILDKRVLAITLARGGSKEFLL